MISETVVMSVGDVPFQFYAVEEMAVGAKVVADFLLRNPAVQVESLPVGFPLFLSQTPPRIGFQEVWRLRVFINGVEVPTTETNVRGEPWSIWDMNFPPGDTLLRVTYDVPLAAPYSQAAVLRYVMHTGAGWAGSIGQGDLIVRFPYPAEETFISQQRTLPGYTAGGFDVRWHFENLEPTEADDLTFRFVDPDKWRDVARARQAVLADGSSQNYWNLAREFANIIAEYDPNYADSPWSFYSPLIAQIAEAQYLQAIELDPANQDLRNEFAEFVSKQAGIMLSTESVSILTQVAATPLATAAISNPTQATAAPSAVPPPTALAEITPTGETTLALTSAPLTALPSAIVLNSPSAQPTPTVIPAPTKTGSAIPWIVGGTIAVILIGLWLALRRPART